MVNNSMVNMNKDGIWYNADLSLSTDFQFAGKKKRTQVNPNYTSYSGFNKKYMTDEGVFDASASLAEFARNATNKRIVTEETIPILSRQVQADSHEAFIYNMLISWIKAKLYVDNGGEDEKFKIKTIPYIDSHAIIPIDQLHTEHTYEIELGFPCDESIIGGNAWVIRNSSNYWEKPYVILYNASQKKPRSILLSSYIGKN